VNVQVMPMRKLGERRDFLGPIRSADFSGLA